MEKKVFFLIHPRRKAIKFVSTPGSSDVAMLDASFSEACKTDAVLKSMTTNKIVIFQMRDETGAWCDMEPEDSVKNLTEINVVLIQNPDITNENNSANSSALNNLEAGQILPLELNVLYTESSKKVELPVDPLLIPTTSNSLLENKEEFSAPVNKKLKVEPQSESLAPAKKSIKLSVLPTLTAALTSKLINGKINLADSKDYFKFWGEYLWQETDGEPTRNDYGIFAGSIVAAYPELSGGTLNTGIVRSQLSTWVRNHRSSLRLKSKNIKPGHSVVNDSKIKLSQGEYASVKVKSALTANDIDAALKELEKPFKAGKNYAHVERLLEDTKDNRRAWIEKQAGNVIEIIDKYPCLVNHHMIIHECVVVIFEKKVDSVFVVIDRLLDELYTYYATDSQVKCSKLLSDSITERTDKVDSMIIEQVYKDLLSKPMRNKDLNPLWKSCEVLTSTENLASTQLSAPRAVVYFSPEDVITQAFVLADAQVKIEIPEPTVTSVLLTLLSTYYTWHLNFPPAYHSILDFLFFKIFDVNFKKQNGGAAKFDRLLNSKKK